MYSRVNKTGSFLLIFTGISGWLVMVKLMLAIDSGSDNDSVMIVIVVC